MMRRTLATPRLCLTPLREPDREFYCRLYADADVMRHVGRALTRAEANASFDATRQGMRLGEGPFVFVLRAGRAAPPSGLCAIRRHAAAPGAAEAGILLLQRARRRGLAQEALQVLLRAAFEALPIGAVWVQYRRANRRAARLFRSLGFQEGITARPAGARPRLCVQYLDRQAFAIPSKAARAGRVQPGG